MDSKQLQIDHQHERLNKLDEQHFQDNHHSKKEILFKVNNISFGYSKKKILNGLSIDIYKGDFTVVIGPNGCGKSTLIKNLVRINLPECGNILFKDKLIYSPNPFQIFVKEYFLKLFKKKTSSKEVQSLEWFKKNRKQIGVYKPKNLALEISYVPQITNFPENTSIYDFVKMGRFPHSNALGFSTNPKKEQEIINDALAKVGILDIKNEDINNVSGGQRQKALIAMSLAQQTDTIILDEPTNHLDIKAQLEIMSLLHKLHHELNKSIILVIHDINVGIKNASRVCVMKDGKILRYGKTHDVIDSDVLLEAFGVNTIIETEDGSMNITEFSLPKHEILDELHVQKTWDEHLKKHDNLEK